MHTVYVLKSKTDGNLYVGCTGNLSKRLAQHERGRVQSTKGRRPLEMIYCEKYESKYDAYQAEREYKTAKGKKLLKERLSK